MLERWNLCCVEDRPLFTVRTLLLLAAACLKVCFPQTCWFIRNICSPREMLLPLLLCFSHSVLDVVAFHYSLYF